MRYDEIITLGELFEIRYGDLTVHTKLQEIVSETEFIILQPTVKGVPLQAEDRDVMFTFYRPNGCYSFNARFSPPLRKGNIMFCRVMRVSEIRRIQRRQCYRMPIVLDVSLYGLDDEGKLGIKYCRGKTKDLSEKSVTVSCFTAFEEETPLAVEISLSDVDTVMLWAKVLRSVNPQQATDPYEIVLVFTDHDEKDRAFLRRYIFRKQILLRKKIRKLCSNRGIMEVVYYGK